METKIKKTDLVKSKVVRDAGDDRKVEKSVTSASVIAQNEACDRGDSVAKIGVEKIKVTGKKKTEALLRAIDQTPSNVPKEDRRRRDEVVMKDALTRKAEMKKIRDNYTFRNKLSLKRDGECGKNSVEKVEELPKKLMEDIKSETPTNSTASPTEYSKSVLFPNVSNTSAITDIRRRTTSKTALAQSLIRRPIIKTITSKNDKTKVYKAVNFVDKRVQPTPLQINIPSDRPKDTKIKATLNKVISKVSVKDKRRKDKKRKVTKPPADSPDITAVKLRSPPTEVAKWVSADNHTKLYYEAWVDTTLAAISKKVKDKKFDKKALMETFQKALACRPVPSDMDYKMMLDEKYTGKIKVNKR